MMKKAICFLVAAVTVILSGITASALDYEWKDTILEFAEYCKNHTYKERLRYFRDYVEDGDGDGAYCYLTENDLQFVQSGKNALIVVKYRLEEKLYSDVKFPPREIFFHAYMSDGAKSRYDPFGKNSECQHVLTERNVFTVKEHLLEMGVDDPKGLLLFAINYADPFASGIDVLGYELFPCENGWNEIEGNRYYIKSDGTILTKSATIDGIRYKFDKSGVCQGKYTGYTMSNKGKRYWKNGELVKNRWIKVKGERKYYAGSDGYFVTGTRKIDGKKYSFDENGALKKLPEKKEFPRIEVKFPDGAVYESSDGGENWTKDGEEAQRPLVYAAFEGECPLSWSGDACLTIYNGSVPSLIENGVWFLRKENGEWIEAEYLEEVEVLAASAYVIGENAEGRFKIPPELYVPFEGKCRYIHEMRDFNNQIYTVSAEFSIVGESTESVSP